MPSSSDRPTAAPADLIIELRRYGPDAPSLTVQLADAIREAIVGGLLEAGARIPASRRLASRLGVSRGTVVAALDQLVAEGYLSARHGSGTIVNPNLPTVHRGLNSAQAKHQITEPEPHVPAAEIILLPGLPDTSAVADSLWRSAWRNAAAEVGSSDLDAAGLPRARAELALHLRHMRGVAVDAAEVVMTGGARDGLASVLAVLSARRGRGLVVAVEDPGYPSLRQVPRRMGAVVVPTPVDEQGLVVGSLPRHLDVVMVTPSHQYPLGASMSAARRGELLEGARRRRAVVVEDDYDSELRYVGAPLPALAALDRRDQPSGDRVVTLGSLSKTVTPALGLGYLLLPEWLRPEVVTRRRELGSLPSTLSQRALASYMAGGGLRRHIERMRRTYRRRQRVLLAALEGLNEVRVQGMDGGLHVVAAWTTGTVEKERTAKAALAEAGIHVGTLSEYWSNTSWQRRYGLVIGYAAVDDATLCTSAAVIRHTLAKSCD